MKKVAIFLILASLFAQLAQAQYFTISKSVSSVHVVKEAHNANSEKVYNIQPNEQVYVDSLLKKGWCRVICQKDTEEQAVGYTLIELLSPADEVAEAMLTQSDKRFFAESQVIKWGVILAGIGLLLSFMGFLGQVRNVLLAVVIILLSALEIYFLLYSNGFTFYSPTVVGWGAAIKWFLVFTAFLLIQIYLWFKTIWNLTPAPEIVGNVVAFTLVTLLAAFVAVMVTFFVPSFKEQYIVIGIIAVMALIVVYFFIQTAIKGGILKALLITPVFAVGIAAIGLMAVDVFIVAIIAVFAIPLLGGLVQAGTTYQQGTTDQSGRTKYKWVDGVNPLNIFKK